VLKLREQAIPLSHETGMPRGFAFVTFSNDGDAQDAIKGLNGSV
jgi:RNA recognition motif-containing protein